MIPKKLYCGQQKRQKKYKEKFPAEHMKLDLQRKKKAEMITSATFRGIYRDVPAWGIVRQ